jgi:hypothetical protein
MAQYTRNNTQHATMIELETDAMMNARQGINDLPGEFNPARDQVVSGFGGSGRAATRRASQREARHH